MYIDLNLSTDKLQKHHELYKHLKLVQQRQLSVPLLLFLHGNQPLGFVCGQFLHFFAPMLNLISPSQHWRQWAELFSSTDGVDNLVESLREMK